MTNTPSPKALRKVADIIQFDTNMEEHEEIAAWMREQADKHELAQKTARAVRVGLHRLVQDLEIGK